MKSILITLHETIPCRSLRAKVIHQIYRYSYYHLFRRFDKNGFRSFRYGTHFGLKFKNGLTILSNDDVSLEAGLTLPGFLANYEIKKGDVVVDCGAFQGIFALYAAYTVGPSGKVFAFEPDPINREKLTANLALNKIDNIVIIPKGVWSENTVLRFSIDNSGSSVFYADELETALEIPVVSLDDELGGRGIERVDFIKMDIEGAEIEAIKGGVKLLKNGAHLAIASYHIVNGQKTYQEVERLLKNIGYECHTSFPLHLTTHAIPPPSTSDLNNKAN